MIYAHGNSNVFFLLWFSKWNHLNEIIYRWIMYQKFIEKFRGFIPSRTDNYGRDCTAVKLALSDGSRRASFRPLILSIRFICCTAPVYSVDGSTFTISRVNRLHMGAYLCIASNGVPPSVSKRVTLIVHCKWTERLRLRAEFHIEPFLLFAVPPMIYVQVSWKPERTIFSRNNKKKTYPPATHLPCRIN